VEAEKQNEGLRVDDLKLTTSVLSSFSLKSMFGIAVAVVVVV
jgi:hypothetical protein